MREQREELQNHLRDHREQLLRIEAEQDSIQRSNEAEKTNLVETVVAKADSDRGSLLAKLAKQEEIVQSL